MPELSLGTIMEREIKSIQLWRSIITECLATTFYVLIGCLATLNWEPQVFSVVGLTSSDLVYISFTFGLGACALTQCFGHISGAHMNPAITMATLLTCKVTPVRGALYMVAQCGGGIAGAALLYGLAPPEQRQQAGVTSLHRDLGPIRGFGIELILTFLLVFTYFATTDPNRRNHGNQSIPLGLTVTMIHLAGYRLTGSSSNPARSLGPAFITNSWMDHWVYWAGPLVGGVVAGVLYEYIFDPYRRGKSFSEEVISVVDRAPPDCKRNHQQLYSTLNTRPQSGIQAYPQPPARTRGLENSAYNYSSYSMHQQHTLPHTSRHSGRDTPNDVIIPSY